MTFSKNIATYPAEWLAVLEQFGTGAPVKDIIKIGPFESKQAAVHERFRFYAFTRLIEKTSYVSTEAHLGCSVSILRVKEDPDPNIGWWIEISDRNRNFPPVQGLTVPVRPIQEVETESLLKQVYDAQEERERKLKEIAQGDVPRKYY